MGLGFRTGAFRRKTATSGSASKPPHILTTEETILEAHQELRDRTAVYLRQNGRRLIVEVLINFILPFVIYDYGEGPLGPVGALLASSAPPILWSLAEFACHRRVDAVSLFVLGGIALSLLAMLGGGGVRFLQLREKLVTAVIGLVFLGSAAVGKPLVYEFVRASMRRRSDSEARQFEALKVHAGFRRTMKLMTVVWGVGLLTDAAVSVILVFTLTIRQCLIFSNIVGCATLGFLSLWTYLYGRRSKRRGEARRAAMDSDTQSPRLSDGSSVEPDGVVAS